ncbi:MFS transporter [Niveispirillum sp. KHB5.9]|uniref:MFS transporter n=1 Tax=Niveispirillum sp. KHB5.9 TaxID=3400269 RepID=UPI003A8BFAD7
MTRTLICALLVMGTLLGMAGIDLILPALPVLATLPGGDVPRAQLVIAAYVAGAMGGMLLFGTLAARFDRRLLLMLAIAGFGVLMGLSVLVQDLDQLIALRFGQGLVGSAPAVFAPGIIRRLFDEVGAMRALALLGSIEAIAPGAAPLAGAALIAWAGWQAPFLVVALASLIVLTCLGAGLRILPGGRVEKRREGSYLRLLRDPVFLRYGLSHGGVLGGLLIFVFGAPVTITVGMGGTMGDFVVMQAIGVTLFAIAANLAGGLARRFGVERMIWIGTVLAFLSGLLLLAYGWTGGGPVWVLSVLFAPMNIGLGLRGPPGFLRAIMAGRGDDDRASALVILFITGISSAGTALLAPFITLGLPALTLAVAIVQTLGVAALLLPRLPD